MADNDMLHTAEILKAALPYVDVRTKTTMDLLVRLYELIGCYHSLRYNGLAACGYETEQKADFEGLLNKVRPVCNDRERSFIDRILGFFNAKRMYEMYNQYMEAMKTMQEFGGFSAGNPDGEAADNTMNSFSGFDFASMFGSGKADSGDNHDTDNDMPSSDDDSEFFTGQAENPDPSDHEAGSEEEDSDPPPRSNAGNDQMLDMLKNMVPPEQMSTFENLRMLFNTMSYDGNRKSDES